MEQHHQQYYGSGTATMTETASPPRLTTTASVGSNFNGGMASSVYGDAVAQATSMVTNEISSVAGSNMEVIGEQVIEHKVTVPIRRQREEIQEKLIRVPVKVIREEIAEETHTVRERIIQVAQPVEKKVYVDEPYIVEKLREVPVPVVVDKINVEYVERVHNREVVNEVPVVVYKDQEVEVEHTQYVYKDNPVVVQQHEVKYIHKVVEKPVNRIQEVEVPVYKEVEVLKDIPRNVPAPLEQITHQDYHLPQIETEYEEVPFPVFVPSFTEVSVAAEYVTEEALLQAADLQQKVLQMAGSTMPSLCVVENLGEAARKLQIDMSHDPKQISDRMASKIAQHHKKQQSQRRPGNPGGNQDPKGEGSGPAGDRKETDYYLSS